MSVDRTDYIFYGWKLPYDMGVDFFDDKFLPMTEGHKGEEYAIIVDGMNGDYTVFGIMLGKSKEEDGWDFASLDFKNLDSKKLNKKFNEVFGFEAEIHPELFIFSNFA